MLSVVEFRMYIFKAIPFQNGIMYVLWWLIFAMTDAESCYKHLGTYEFGLLDSFCGQRFFIANVSSISIVEVTQGSLTVISKDISIEEFLVNQKMEPKYQCNLSKS